MEKPSNDPDSNQEPPPPPPPPSSETHKAKNDDDDDEEKGNAETLREPKRRKSCPIALDTVEDFTNSSSNSNLSFSFPTKFAAASPLELTPKFGSFNSTISTEDLQEKTLAAAANGEEGEGSEEASEVVNCTSLSSSFDGVKEIE